MPFEIHPLLFAITAFFYIVSISMIPISFYMDIHPFKRGALILIVVGMTYLFWSYEGFHVFMLTLQGLFITVSGCAFTIAKEVVEITSNKKEGKPWFRRVIKKVFIFALLLSVLYTALQVVFNHIYS